jgi:hypothetical protein
MSLTLREEHKLRVFENRVLRIFGPKRDGVTEGWKPLHNEELNDLYSSSTIIGIMKSRRMRWRGLWNEWGRRGKRPLGRPRLRWLDNIMMDLLEMGLSVVDWIGLAQGTYSWRALVNAVMYLRVP